MACLCAIWRVLSTSICSRQKHGSVSVVSGVRLRHINRVCNQYILHVSIDGNKCGSKVASSYAALFLYAIAMLRVCLTVGAGYQYMLYLSFNDFTVHLYILCIIGAYVFGPEGYVFSIYLNVRIV